MSDYTETPFLTPLPFRKDLRLNYILESVYMNMALLCIYDDNSLKALFSRKKIFRSLETGRHVVYFRDRADLPVSSEKQLIIVVPEISGSYGSLNYYIVLGRQAVHQLLTRSHTFWTEHKIIQSLVLDGHSFYLSEGSEQQKDNLVNLIKQFNGRVVQDSSAEPISVALVGGKLSVESMIDFVKFRLQERIELVKPISWFMDLLQIFRNNEKATWKEQIELQIEFADSELFAGISIYPASLIPDGQLLYWQGLGMTVSSEPVSTFVLPGDELTIEKAKELRLAGCVMLDPAWIHECADNDELKPITTYIRHIELPPFHSIPKTELSAYKFNTVKDFGDMTRMLVATECRKNIPGGVDFCITETSTTETEGYLRTTLCLQSYLINGPHEYCPFPHIPYVMSIDEHLPFEGKSFLLLLNDPEQIEYLQQLLPQLGAVIVGETEGTDPYCIWDGKSEIAHLSELEKRVLVSVELFERCHEKLSLEILNQFKVNPAPLPSSTCKRPAETPLLASKRLAVESAQLSKGSMKRIVGLVMDCLKVHGIARRPLCKLIAGSGQCLSFSRVTGLTPKGTGMVDDFLLPGQAGESTLLGGYYFPSGLQHASEMVKAIADSLIGLLSKLKCEAALAENKENRYSIITSSAEGTMDVFRLFVQKDARHVWEIKFQMLYHWINYVASRPGPLLSVISGAPVVVLCDEDHSSATSCTFYGKSRNLFVVHGMSNQDFLKKYEDYPILVVRNTDLNDEDSFCVYGGNKNGRKCGLIQKKKILPNLSQVYSASDAVAEKLGEMPKEMFCSCSNINPQRIRRLIILGGNCKICGSDNGTRVMC